MMRRLAPKIRMVHTMRLSTQFFRIKENGGPINTDQTFEIDGPSLNTTIRGRSFVQKCYWNEDALCVLRSATDGAYSIEYRRTFEDGMIRIEHVYKSAKTTVNATSWFECVPGAPLLPELPDETRLSASSSNAGSPKIHVDPRRASRNASRIIFSRPSSSYQSTRERPETVYFDARSSFNVPESSLYDAPEMKAYVAQIVRIEHETIIPVTISVENVSYYVKVNNSSKRRCGSSLARKRKVVVEEKKLLDDVCVRANPGEVMAMMGPSGAGKSTLLNAMLARRSGRLEGSITYDGRDATPELVRPIAKFVPQEPTLRATSTCYETLQLACALTLSPSLSKESVEAHIRTLLQKFGLAEQANVLVGNDTIKGLSGGQKKRLSIALELVTLPRALFLDEPTSGLDSRTAVDVMNLLLSMARDSINVICTIHQPPANIFRQFDRLVLLVRGEVAYYGKVQDAEQYFSLNAGRECPIGENIANFYLDVLVDDGPTLAKTWRDQRDVGSRLEEGSNASAEVEKGEESFQYSIGTFGATWLLLKNIVTAVRKNPRDGPFRCKSTAVIALLTSLCFTTLKNKQQWAATTRSLLFIMMMYCFISAVNQTAVVMALEKAWLQHEFHNARFSFLSWFLARFATFIVCQTFYTVLYATIIYFISLGDEPFGWFLVVLILHSWASGLLGFLIGTFARDIQHSNALLAPVLLPSFLFSGFLFTRTQCPDYFLFLWYTSFFRYGLEALTYTQFKDGDFLSCGQQKFAKGRCPFGLGTVKRSVALDAWEIETEPYYFYLNVLVVAGFIVFTASLGFYASRRQLYSFSF